VRCDKSRYKVTIYPCLKKNSKIIIHLKILILLWNQQCLSVLSTVLLLTTNSHIFCRVNCSSGAKKMTTVLFITPSKNQGSQFRKLKAWLYKTIKKSSKFHWIWNNTKLTTGSLLPRKPFLSANWFFLSQTRKITNLFKPLYPRQISHTPNNNTWCTYFWCNS